MKTIKARARAYAQTRNQNTYAYDGYLKGAIEQQALDNVQLCEIILDNRDAVIDKACEWMESHAYHLATRDIEQNIDDFIKAMKGE